MRKRYGNAPRHTMQVDFEPYVKEIIAEMKRGATGPTTVFIQP